MSVLVYPLERRGCVTVPSMMPGGSPESYDVMYRGLGLKESDIATIRAVESRTDGILSDRAIRADNEG
jgi:hypothetical protein